MFKYLSSIWSLVLGRCRKWFADFARYVDWEYNGFLAPISKPVSNLQRRWRLRHSPDKWRAVPIQVSKDHRIHISWPVYKPHEVSRPYSFRSKNEAFYAVLVDSRVKECLPDFWKKDLTHEHEQW